MSNEPLKIAFTGVYDIANYGDHLFPIIFDKIMKMKGLNIKLYLFSPVGGTQSLSLNEIVYPLNEMESLHLKHNFDAIIVGGGGIFHYASGQQKIKRDSDEFVDYPVFETWVIPSIVAYKHNIKLIWNLLGGYHDFSPFYQKLTQALCDPIDYISVRDNYTKKILTDSGIEDTLINVFPDSAFMMTECIPHEIIEKSLKNLRNSDKEYIVYHANRFLPKSAIPDVVKSLDYFYNLGFEIILLPLAYTHDDESILREINQNADSRYTLYEKELNMYEIMSMLAGCHAYIGVSFHGAITAACHGKKVVAFDYMLNGKTKDLFKMLDLQDYYVTDSNSLYERTVQCHKNMSPVILDDKIASLHQHFDTIIELLVSTKTREKGSDNFLINFSNTISNINKSFSALQSEFSQLDNLSRDTHIKYVELQDKHAELCKLNIELKDNINTFSSANNELQDTFNALQLQNKELFKQKTDAEKWIDEMKKSRTYNFIKTINSIKLKIKDALIK
ncbi:polysaccharide pyruvyl transferase family protein [Enterobacter quasiroggenkampii]|uniref:polysaccharide pyruvyl transferase family protein n=1 Tax=Enterobacter quasiroggenkampii TaxID=2497436 RepID=UPI002075A109|nr:polysaccharide pyruvyl transferase family protein [Enterobacter quasiroggenkampii]MCM7533458.1 polysaccharide pyruvyl transferase family protein [Enterobacter quasiroggenkampii]